MAVVIEESHQGKVYSGFGVEGPLLDPDFDPKGITEEVRLGSCDRPIRHTTTINRHCAHPR
jgi:hypothetical protein